MNLNQIFNFDKSSEAFRRVIILRKLIFPFSILLIFISCVQYYIVKIDVPYIYHLIFLAFLFSILSVILSYTKFYQITGLIFSLGFISTCTLAVYIFNRFNFVDFTELPIFYILMPSLFGFYTMTRPFFVFVAIFSTICALSVGILTSQKMNQDMIHALLFVFNVNLILILMNHQIAKDERQLKESKIAVETTAMQSLAAVMSAGIAHELKNPVSVAIAYVDRWFNKGEDEVKIPKNDLLKVSNQLERVVTIINAMKNISKTQNLTDAEDVGLFELLKEIAAISKYQLIDNKIDFEINKPENDLHFKVLKTLLLQALLNLIQNAIDAHKNTPNAWIKLNATLIQDKIIFSVVDSGTGIPKEIAEKIMKPFYTTKAHGNGLGLSISKTFIEKMNGSFYLDANYKNTRFVVEIPTGSVIVTS